VSTNKNPYFEEWQKLEASSPEPQFVSKIVEVNYAEFTRKVFEAEPNFISETLLSLYSGTAFVLKNCISKETCEHLIMGTLKIKEQTPSSFHKMLDGCPNFNRIIDQEVTKKYSTRAIRHSFYFFRWNEDPLGLWKLVTPIWQTLKYVGGFDRDAYEHNTPKDLIIDRLQIVRYPSGGGGLKRHVDAKHNQKLIFGIMMSRRGEDYDSGGFYAVDESKKHLDFEDYLDVGDIVMCYPTIEHGVDDVDLHKPLDWNAPDGRWFIGFYSNDSDHVKERKTSTALG